MGNRRGTLQWLAIAALLPGAALAAPEGAQVVSGEATVTREGDLTQIQTGTPQTIINWTGGFDIGAHETVSIQQPDALSNVLNYDLSTDPTNIDGRLFSNGGVWIINPVGVFFGDKAVVDVGRLVAGAGTVDQGDFLAGVERFTGLTGDVEVAAGAQIRAADSALLVGAAVANYGNISVGDGMIALVAGGEVRLARADGRVVVTADRPVAPDPDRWAVVQAGSLDAGRGSVSLTAGDAYSLAINHSGITRAHEIHAEGGDGGLVQVAGELDASSRAPGETGGRIEVLGDQVLVGDASLDASGPAGGGDIRVGGDLRGGGELRTARRTYVSDDAQLRADALAQGDGGRIIIWADEATRFYGNLSARGAGEGGDGGFAEISGQSLVARGAVDLGAESGSAGTLLYDPKDIVIRGGSNDGSDDPDVSDAVVVGSSPGQVLLGDFADLATPFEIFESEIEGTDANVVLEATNSITTSGAFNHVAAGEGTGVVRLVDGRSLALRTRNDPGDEMGGAAAPGIDLAGVSIFVTEGGSVLLTTGNGEVAVGDITSRGSDGTAGGNGGAVTLLAGGTGSVVAGDIDASGGDGSAGDGGAGGSVTLNSIGGSVTVGAIDVSGGDGTAHLVDNGAGGTAVAGRGGNAGAISLVADIDPASGVPVVPDGDMVPERFVTVTGDLTARGGDGLGTATDSSGALGGAAGGTGGQMLISAGVAADQENEGHVVLGSAAQPVALDASGGAGTAAGGSASFGGTSALSGDPIGAIRLEAHESVTADAELVAQGGAAGVSGGPGGFGGLGGDIAIETEVGSVVLNDTPGTEPLVVTDGGAGRIATVVIDNGVPRFDGQGGSAGSFTVAVAGAGSAVAVEGAVHARGGDGLLGGAGGAGGNVTLTAADGAIEVSDVDVTGGDGNGSVTAPPATTAQGVRGGNGGNVTVTASAGTGAGAAGGGNAMLGGTIISRGGTGVPNPDGTLTDLTENHGVGGTVKITSALDIAAAGASNARIRAGTIAIDGRNVFATGTPHLALVAAGSGPAGTVERATVTAGRNDATGHNDPALASTGNVRVRFDDQDTFDRFEVVETDARGSVEVRSEGGALIADGDGADGTGTVHTIDELDTSGLAPHFTYRLADPVVTTSPDGELVEQIDVTTLAVASGAVTVGASGVKLANARADASQFEGERLLGKIQGTGAAPHVNATGNLEVFATSIGDATPLAIAGAGGASPSVELSVAGDIGRVDADDLPDVAGVQVSGTVERVDLVQRSASGDVAIDLPGAGAVAIDGTVVDDGASRKETSVVTQVDNTGGPEFYLHLADDSLSGDEAGSGEPVLQIEAGAVTLGANAGFAAAGEIELERDAIDAGGQQVALVADSNLDGRGAIDALEEGTEPHVQNASALAVIAGAGVGTAEAPLLTSAAPGGELVLAAVAGAGDLQLVNANGGRIAVAPVGFTVANEGTEEDVTYRGVSAGGAIALENGAGEIELRDVQEQVGEDLSRPNGAPSFGVTGEQVDSNTNLRIGFGNLRLPLSQLVAADPAVSAPHVQSGGSQEYGGSLVLASDASLVAGGGVQIDGDVDGVGRDLTVSAGGTTELGGDVGAAGALDVLTLTDVRFAGGGVDGINRVAAAQQTFGAIDGPSRLELRGGSSIAIRGDVGAREALTSFDADADRLVFGERNEGPVLIPGADRIVAGSVALNNVAPGSSISDAATIADTGGGLSIESAGDVAMGSGEKLSVTGTLAIRAGGTATLSDLSASELQIDAARIVMQGRAPGPVAQPSGAVVTDFGVDWAANNITTNVVPEWDGVGTRPTFALGSGGIRTGGAIPFDVVRFTPELDSIGAQSFAGSGRVLDLTGIGPRVVSDASQDQVRDATPVQPWVPARFDDAPPAPPRAVSGEELLALLRCRDGSGEPCRPPAPGDDPLTSERARELTQRYRALLGTPFAQSAVAQAFAPLAQRPLPSTEAGGVDGRALARLVASGAEMEPARAQIGELAVTLAQVELLGLEETESELVRRAIASEFAAATGIADLDADAVLDAVDASGVAVLP